CPLRCQRRNSVVPPGHREISVARRRDRNVRTTAIVRPHEYPGALYHDGRPPSVPERSSTRSVLTFSGLRRDRTVSANEDKQQDRAVPGHDPRTLTEAAAFNSVHRSSDAVATVHQRNVSGKRLSALDRVGISPSAGQGFMTLDGTAVPTRSGGPR